MNELPGDPTLPPGVSMRDIDPPPRPEEGEDDDEDRRYWSWLDRITREEP